MLITGGKFGSYENNVYLCTAFRRNRWQEEEWPVMLRWNDKQF